MKSYDDIIDMPHHISSVHLPMSAYKRAAQFAPFAALSGYEEKIAESGRYTERKIILSEDMKNSLDRKLQLILHNLAACPEVTFTYFRKDMLKEGGKYIKARGRVQSVNFQKKEIYLENETVSLPDVVAMESDIFPE